MADRSSKDEAYEALDFIVNVLKEHEKDLDKLITDLKVVSEKIGDKGELSSKVGKLEERINSFQLQIASLIKKLPIQTSGVVSSNVLSEQQGKGNVDVGANLPYKVSLECKHWDDFLVRAFRSNIVSFGYSESEKKYNVKTVKNNQVFRYVGVLPDVGFLLRSWLSKRLDVLEKQIVEGEIEVV